MIGTLLNVAGIVLGGAVGLLKKKPLSLANQFFLKAALGVSTVYCGLHLLWISVNGPFLQILKQLAIVVVSLTLGRLAGRLMHLQKASNGLGQFARARMVAAKPDNSNRFSEGFNVCTALFCAAPLGILGAIHSGLSNYFYPLAIKAVMDGLATMSFIGLFGWGVMLSAVPVLVFQGTITLVCARFLQPLLETHSLIDPVNATGGVLICSVALIIFDVKKVAVADYLPSLVFAPLLASWLH